MKATCMVLTSDGISVQSFAERKDAEAWVKEKCEYHTDGRRYVIEERKTPETIRDIITLFGVASNDRKLTVNGKPFRVVKTDTGIDLIGV
jgi:hypothetical protein